MVQPLNWNVVVQSSNFPHLNSEMSFTLMRGAVSVEHAWFMLPCTESKDGRGKQFVSHKWKMVFSLVHL